VEIINEVEVKTVTKSNHVEFEVAVEVRIIRHHSGETMEMRNIPLHDHGEARARIAITESARSMVVDTIGEPAVGMIQLLRALIVLIAEGVDLSVLLAEVVETVVEIVALLAEAVKRTLLVVEAEMAEFLVVVVVSLHRLVVVERAAP